MSISLFPDVDGLYSANPQRPSLMPASFQVRNHSGTGSHGRRCWFSQEKWDWRDDYEIRRQRSLILRGLYHCFRGEEPEECCRIAEEMPWGPFLFPIFLISQAQGNSGWHWRWVEGALLSMLALKRPQSKERLQHSSGQHQGCQRGL